MGEYSVSAFLNMAYEDAAAATMEPLKGLGDWEGYRRGQLDRIRDFLCLPKLEGRYTIPLKWELKEEGTVPGAADVRLLKYRVDAIKNLPLSVHALKAVENPEKVFLYLLGHDARGAVATYLPEEETEANVPADACACDGGAADAADAAGACACGNGTEQETAAPNLVIEAARRGYLVLIPDLMAYGDAKREDSPEDIGACESCDQIAPWLTNCGLNLLGIRVWEAIRTMDFAEAAFDLNRVTVYGISGGGHVCNYTGVLDDRIETMIVAAYPNLYWNSTMAMRHCICNYVPNQIEIGESYYITSLAAPNKRLLLINGDKDPIFPIEGSRVAFSYVKKVYERLGAPELFSSVLFDGTHEEDAPDVLRFLDGEKLDGQFFAGI